MLVLHSVEHYRVNKSASTQPIPPFALLHVFPQVLIRVKTLMAEIEAKKKMAPVEWTEEEKIVLQKAASKVYPPGTCHTCHQLSFKGSYNLLSCFLGIDRRMGTSRTRHTCWPHSTCTVVELDFRPHFYCVVISISGMGVCTGVQWPTCESKG